MEIPQETSVAVVINALQRQIIPRLGRAELGAAHLLMPWEMEPKLWRVLREGARDARVA